MQPAIGMESQVSCAEFNRIGNDSIKPAKTALGYEVTDITQGSAGGLTRPSRHIKLSSLERLPIELLHRIFLESLNVNLPRSSPALCSALSSWYVKFKLFLYTFAKYQSAVSVVPRPGQYIWDAKYLCPDPELRPWSSRRLALQRDMLGVRWMTMGIMKEFMKAFTLQTVLSTLGKSPLWAVVESQDGLTGFPSITVLADSILRATHLKLERRPSKESRYRKILILPSYPLVGLEHWECQQPVGEANLDILEIGYSPTGRLQDSTKHLGTDWCILPSFEFGTQIPLRLLHGPWTDEKSDFLELLLRRDPGPHIFRSKTSPILQMADIGLVDAIREENMRAIKNLVSVNGDFEDFAANIGEDYSLHGNHESNNAILTRAGLKAHTLGVFRPCVGVIPQTHHLQIAVLQQNCPKHIVSWLYMARESTIDWNDRQVMGWAARKEAEGDDIGSWLLGLCGRSASEEEDVCEISQFAIESASTENECKAPI